MEGHSDLALQWPMWLHSDLSPSLGYGFSGSWHDHGRAWAFAVTGTEPGSFVSSNRPNTETRGFSFKLLGPWLFHMSIEAA